MRKLSKYFAESELLVSRDYPELAAEMILTKKERDRLAFYLQTVADPVRAHVNRKARVLSGKRSRLLNKRIGGAENSQHLYCEAIDLTFAPLAGDELAELLTTAFEFLRDKCYYSIRWCGYYIDRGFIHIGFHPMTSGIVTANPRFSYILKGRRYDEHPLREGAPDSSPVAPEAKT